MIYNKYRLSELPKEKLNNITEKISRFSTPVRVVYDGDSCIPVGSATFVRYKNKIGFLGAAHVLNNRNRVPMKLGIYNQRTLVFDFFSCKTVHSLSSFRCLNPGNLSFDDPDVAFVELHTELVLNEYEKNVWDFQNSFEDFQIAPPKAYLKITGVCGVPSRDTVMYYDKEIDRDMVVYKDAGVYYAPEHRSQDIDVTIDGKVYVTDNIFIEISPECSKDLPETYKGISGGGCWEIYLDKALNCICICLIGVQVAQFPPIRPYQLWCKGPKTITALFSHSQSF